LSFTPSRRDILKAGGAAAAALSLTDFQAVLKGALAAPACGSLSDIEHVVIFIQENHSFDQYFGRYKGVRGFDDRSVRLHPGDDGTSVFRQASPAAVPGPHPLPPFKIDTSFPSTHEGDCTNDIDHQWLDEHAMWNGGQMDKWVSRHVTTNGPGRAAITMGYYDGSPARDGSGELDFYWALADNFTICDDYYCSVIGGTDANRLYSMTGTIDPDGFDGGLQFLDTQGSGAVAASFTLGGAHRWIPYPEVLDAHRNAAGAADPISWKVYSSADQLSPVSDNVLRYFPQYRAVGSSLFQRSFTSDPIVDFALDCQTNSLPQVSWIIVDSTHSEHAPASILQGQWATAQVAAALMKSQLWSKSAMILTYDENGGFFDHVPPPTPPPGTPGEFLDVSKMSARAKTEAGPFAASPIGLGFRVPTLVISPFSRNPTPTGGPMVCSDRFDHTSLLKLCERIFGAEIPSRDVNARRPGLSPWRRDPKNIGDLSSAFNFAAGPLPAVPSLPATSNADFRTLDQCPLPAGSLAVATFESGYPVPATVPFPVQEASRGPVRRPSGVCAATVSTSPPLTPTVSPSGTPLPDTSGPGGEQGAAEAAMVAILAGAGLASAWWARRRSETAD
jgi:phospholipase C